MKQVNVNKRRVQAIDGGGSEGDRGSGAEGRERSGRQEEKKSLRVIATPLPQLFTTTVINYNSTSATAVTAN